MLKLISLLADRVHTTKEKPSTAWIKSYNCDRWSFSKLTFTHKVLFANCLPARYRAFFCYDWLHTVTFLRSFK